MCCVEGGVLEKGGRGKLLPWFRPGVLGQVSAGRKRHWGEILRRKIRKPTRAFPCAWHTGSTQALLAIVGQTLKGEAGPGARVAEVWG